MKEKIIFSRLKLKSQIILLVGSATGALLILLALYIGFLQINNRKSQRSYMESAVGQLAGELDGFDSDVKKISTNLAYNRMVEEFCMSEDLGLRYILSGDIELFIESIEIANSRIDAVAFTNLEQVIIGTQDREFFRILGHLGEQMKEKGGDGEVNYFMLDERRLISVNRSFYNPKSGEQYYVVLICNLDGLKSLLKKVAGQGEHLLLVESGGEIFMSEGTSTDGDLAISADKADCLEHISASGFWTVKGVVKKEAGSKAVGRYINIMILFVSIVSLLLCLTGCLIYKGIASPVEAIIVFMNQYGKYYNKHRLPVKGTNEIAQISVSVNRMLDDIQDMTHRIMHTQEKLYLTELSKRQAELTALQIQMNPHFLYNTLDCIKGIALVRKVPEIAAIANSMSRILRYSIRSEDVVLVRNEVESITDYLKIIQIRHQNKYDIRVNVEEEVKDMPMPKMILQPLVENAVFYGLESTSRAGELLIEGKREGDFLYFVVENSGNSISREKAEELMRVFEENRREDNERLFSEKSGIGLKNIDKRIKLLYGEQFGISIGQRKGGGTGVKVKLPAAETEDIPEMPI
ncbi:MAG: histidine kinase [Lachnospiraceae bacterium]|nr:histidine kinase [Lachnospiraceae bacterium]